MADYIYLLESRLSKAQQHALNVLREIARERGVTIFLVGGAVRDLTSGSPVRDLDVVVQGNALKLKKDIEKAGGIVSGEFEPGQALFLRFPGSVRLELGSTLTITYPKPGKPVAKPASILDDLRRRDFTANAMALSLNAGSYGLLMDPLNGVADIENRELRLVSNYGFIEDPIRMVRAARLMARLGWQMDEKTQSRYETGKQEGYISAASAFSRGYEAEEIVHEEDPLRVLRRLEAEGWMSEIAPGWTTAKANEAELERLRESQTKLQLQGIHPSPAAANFPLLTAKMSQAEVTHLKQTFPRLGFVNEIEILDAEAKELANQLTSKASALPSQTWKLLYAAKPEAVLQVAFSSKSAAIQAKFKSFFTEWPEARQKVPYVLMQEMRIVPELAGYEEFVNSIIFELMDGKLSTPEELKAFLEPFSPPAPPPPVHLRRARTSKKESKGAKGRAKKTVSADEADLDSQPLANQGSDADFDPDADGDTDEPMQTKRLSGDDDYDVEKVEKVDTVTIPKSAPEPPVTNTVVPTPATSKKVAATVSVTGKLPPRVAAKSIGTSKAAPPAPVKKIAPKAPAHAATPQKAKPAPAPVKAAKKLVPAKPSASRKPLPAKKVVSKAPIKPAAKPVGKASAKPLSKVASKSNQTAKAGIAAKPVQKSGKVASKATVKAKAPTPSKAKAKPQAKSPAKTAAKKSLPPAKLPAKGKPAKAVKAVKKRR